MANYELKSQIMNEMPEMIDLRRKRDKLFYEAMKLGSVKNWSEETLDEISFLDYQFENLSPEYQTEIDRIINSTKARRKRIKHTILDYLSRGECYFLTLTFNEETLHKTNEKSRRVYVARYLADISGDYLANVDYGKENNREHYHAVVLQPNDKIDSWSKYGFYHSQKVRGKEFDAYKLSCYVSKLTNHAIKNSTKQKRLIYSRNK